MKRACTCFHRVTRAACRFPFFSACVRAHSPALDAWIRLALFPCFATPRLLFPTFSFFLFCLQTDPPDYSKVPADDIVGVTVLLLTCSYKGHEFIRVGYYVNTDYADEALREDPPEQPQLDRLVRNILEDKPRVTKFAIEWDDAAGAAGKDLNGASAAGLPAALNDPEASMDAMDLH